MFVRVLPLGNISTNILEAVCAGLEDAFRSKFRLMETLQIPENTHNIWRKQYSAEGIMDFISKIPSGKFIEKTIPTLAITDRDIFHNKLNFVFGVENASQGVCLVSLARLDQKFYDERPNDMLLIQRVIKESAHEIGHYFGLDHCYGKTCVMGYSPSVTYLDEKLAEFCGNCKVKMAAKGINI